MKEVQILLSTYNGAAFLKEQLESLLNQTYSNITILIRDDGSTDETSEILELYSKKYKCITWYSGNNIGVWRSYMDLINHSSCTASYFAFCDQDDYWLPEKIEQSILYLEKNTIIPTLYCSNTILVNKKLKKLELQNNYENFRPSFGNALVQNIVTGCTCVFNKQARDLIYNKQPDYMIMHDWWLYLVVSCFGKVYFDKNAYILYRQHQTNTIGARGNNIEKWKYRIKNFRKNIGRNYLQIDAFTKLYNPPIKMLDLIEDFQSTEYNIVSRFLFFKNKNIYRQNHLDDILYRILVILGLA